MGDHAGRLSALADHWNSVERRIKEYEHFSGDANTSAINELRYAGRKIVDAWVKFAAGDDPTPEITIAENYMVNADHDVTDGACFIVLRHVSKVIKKYGRDRIGECCPDFWELYPVIRKTQTIVEGSREDRVNRKAEYAKLAHEFLPKMRELHEKLIQIKALHVPNEEDELRAIKVRVAVITAITIVGGVFSTLGFFLTWWAWAYPLNYWNIFRHIFHFLFGWL
ncbi:MAG TPA: hypothetical protein VHX61_14025 [Rhizomicrobium sp.]|jgi:hypothetical protein|nr:hypothetical protein [Rhizomicrobium sp.]